MKRFVTFDTGDKMCHLEISHSHPFVLSGGSPGRIRRLAQYLDSVESVVESDRGLVTVHGQYRGLPVTGFSTGMGPASVSIVLPEIIEACDDPNMIILRLGTCGALQPRLNIGDFVITTDVDRAESTSDKIMGAGYRAICSPEVQQTLRQAAEESKLSSQQVYVGRTRVTDDIYFDALESKANKHGDVLGVSMECSVYCALRDRYNRDYGKKIETGELLVVSNNLVEKQEAQADMREFLQQIEEVHAKVGLETLLKMNNKILQRI